MSYCVSILHTACMQLAYFLVIFRLTAMSDDYPYIVVHCDLKIVNIYLCVVNHMRYYIHQTILNLMLSIIANENCISK